MVWVGLKVVEAMLNKKLLFQLLKSKPEKALKYLLLRGRNLITADEWQALKDKSHDTAFTVAGIVRADFLQDIFNAVVEMKEQGIPLAQANALLTEKLQKRGWTGSGNRFKVTLDTNMKVAHSQGFYETLNRRKDTHPYWRWRQIQRNTKRHEHAELDGKVFKVEDAKLFPPVGHGCDCSAVPMTEAEFQKGGYELSTSDKILSDPKLATLKAEREAFDFEPGKVYKPDMAKYSPELRKEVVKAVINKKKGVKA